MISTTDNDGNVGAKAATTRRARVLLLGLLAAFLASAAASYGQRGQPIREPLANSAGEPIAVLSDTKGFDLRPYIRQIKGLVQTNWYAAMPAVARQPRREQGHVAIDFTITKDGEVKDVKFHETSDDRKLDKAAYSAISRSDFPPLPEGFPGDSIKLRFHFYYNEDPVAIEDWRTGGPVAQHADSKIPAIRELAFTVWPGSIQMVAGTKMQFHAKLEGLIDPAVTWRVAGQGCAGKACGDVSPDGVYTAPANIPNPPTITVTATSTVTPVRSAFGTVTIVPAGDSH